MRQKAVRSTKIFSILSNCFPGLYFATQPGTGEDPVPIGGARGNPKDFGYLIASQASEVTQLDKPSLERIVFTEFHKGYIQGKEFFIRFRCGDDVRMQLLATSLATVDLAELLAGAFDQNTPHGDGGGSEEVPSAVELLIAH